MPSPRRFPAPWSAELQPNYYVVRDANGQQIAYIYYECEPGRRSAAKLLTKDEARRIAISKPFFDLDQSTLAQTERRSLLKDGDEALGEENDPEDGPL